MNYTDAELRAAEYAAAIRTETWRQDAEGNFVGDVAAAVMAIADREQADLRLELDRERVAHSFTKMAASGRLARAEAAESELRGLRS